MTSPRVREAANELEQISLLASVMVDEFRNDSVDMPVFEAYDRVYWLRHRLGRIVAKLGAGPYSNPNALTEHYEKYLQKD